jgi:hypothetical protein
MQAVIDVVNETGCSSGLGGNVENDEQNDRPPDDLPEHLITSRAFLITGVAWRSFRRYSPA